MTPRNHKLLWLDVLVSIAFASFSCNMTIQLQVIEPRGEEKVIDLCENDEDMKKITVEQLRKKITQELKISGKIRMVFRTEPLEDSSLLSSYGIRHMSTIHTLLLVPGGLMG